MKKHKYLNDPKCLYEQGNAIINGNAQNKFVHRVSMVNLMLKGLSPKELSSYCGDSERTLQIWLKKVDEKGWESLIAPRSVGRPAKLSKNQIGEIAVVIKDDPHSHGYNAWDGPSLSDYIKQKYEIDYGVRACQKLLNQLEDRTPNKRGGMKDAGHS